MTPTITVYPRIAEADVIAKFRKDRPVLSAAGTLWPHDTFTLCRIADGSITTDPAGAYPPAPAPAPSAEEIPAAEEPPAA